MKLFFGEYKVEYEKYRFPYQVWLLKEKEDALEKIYEAGFLPIRNMLDVFYLCRSLRVNLELFNPSSENRRILNKTSDYSSQLIPLSEFEYTPQIQKFCKDYMDKRFKKGQMSAAGVKNIFTKGVYTHVFVWKKEGNEKPVGYAVCFVNDNLLQYAHAFYDLDLTESHLGIRMLLESVIWARRNHKKYAYLGTVYNPSSLSYKTEFSGVEFFNGFKWSANMDELKTLIGREKEEYLLKDKEYLENYYQGDLTSILAQNGIKINL